MPDTAAEAPSTAVELGADPAPEVEAGWTKAIVVAKGQIPANAGRRKVIVAQVQAPSTYNEDGSLKEEGALKVTGYPKGAAAYYRTDPAVDFGADAPVYTLSGNLRVMGNGGFHDRGNGVKVGSGHPAYAAANIAYILGAREIEIVGLTKAEQEALQPWLDSSKMPGDVNFTFA